MVLHLIRHAKTNQVSQSGKDFDRPLLERGWKQCEELTDYLKKKDFGTSKIICSSAKRTRETLEGTKACFTSSEIEFSEELYLCSISTFLKKIWSENHQKDLVIIGHNFGISDLANYFLDRQDEMRTAEYVCIEFPFDTWEEAFQATGSLKDHYRPFAR